MLQFVDSYIPGTPGGGGSGGVNAYTRQEKSTRIIASPDSKSDAAAKAQPAEEQAAVKAKNTRLFSDNKAAEKSGGSDQAELNLSLTPEEKDAMATAFSSKDGASSLEPEEKETLQKVAERLSKYIEETIAKNAESRQRVEKAMSEWYSMVARGEPRSATELISLLRQAATGSFDAFDELQQ